MARQVSESAKRRREAYKESDLPSNFNYKIRKMFIGEKCPVCGYAMNYYSKDDVIGWMKSKHRPSVQHNIPIMLGGKHELSNISVICHDCNISSQTKLLGELNNKEVISRWLTKNTIG